MADTTVVPGAERSASRARTFAPDLVCEVSTNPELPHRSVRVLETNRRAPGQGSPAPDGQYERADPVAWGP